MSGLTICLLSAVLFFLQGSFLPLAAGGAPQPDLWLVTVALSALMVDRKTTLILTLVGGFLQDIVISNFFGIHLLPYLVVVLLFMKFGRQRYNRHWYVSVMAVLFATVVYMLVSSLLVWAARSHFPPLYYFISIGLPLLLMNGIAAVVMHHVVWHIRQEGETLW